MAKINAKMPNEVLVKFPLFFSKTIKPKIRLQNAMVSTAMLAYIGLLIPLLLNYIISGVAIKKAQDMSRIIFFGFTQ